MKTRLKFEEFLGFALVFSGICLVALAWMIIGWTVSSTVFSKCP